MTTATTRHKSGTREEWLAVRLIQDPQAKGVTTGMKCRIHPRAYNQGKR